MVYRLCKNVQIILPTERNSFLAGAGERRRRLGLHLSKGDGPISRLQILLPLPLGTAVQCRALLEGTRCHARLSPPFGGPQVLPCSWCCLQVPRRWPLLLRGVVEPSPAVVRKLLEVGLSVLRLPAVVELGCMVAVERSPDLDALSQDSAARTEGEIVG